MSVQDTDQTPFEVTYQGAAAANVVIKATQGLLHSIIIGKAVGAGAIVEVSDHATDGDGNVKVYLEAPAVGTYLVDGMFEVGICVDLTNQTNVAFVWR